jgi:GGDEF domain-containing protein
MGYEIEEEEDLPSAPAAPAPQSSIPPMLARKPPASAFEVEGEEDLPTAAPTPASTSAFQANVAPGMKTPGNLDPYNRKRLDNPDGSVSTTSSISIGTDDGEVLIPTVVDGKRLTNEEAIAHYRKTGEHLGVFDNVEDADRYAESLHNDQASKMGLGGDPVAATRDTVTSALEDSKGPSTRGGQAKLPQLDEVLVQGERPRPETKWSELPNEASAAIGGRIENKIAGAMEWSGARGKQNAQLDLWRSLLMPKVVQEANEQGIAITEHPDVVENAKRIGVSPFVFARDWAKYVNMPEDQRAQLQSSAIQRIILGGERKNTGEQRRLMAAKVASLYAPNLGGDFSPKNIIFQSATSVPDLLLGVAGGAVGGPVVGLGAMGATELPEMFSQGRNAGLSVDKSLSYGALMTAADLVTELPMLEALKGTPAGKKAMKLVVGKYAEKMGGKILSETAFEAAGESITQAMQDALDNGYLDKNMSIGDALKDIAQAGIVGGFMGGTVGAGVEGTHALAESRAKKKAEAQRRANATPDDLTDDEATAELRADLERTRASQDKERARRMKADAGLGMTPPLGDLPTVDDDKTVPLDDPSIERRKDAEKRKAVAEMTPDELRKELLTSPLTGLPNRRAYDEAPKKKVQASVDVDSLKWVNDNAGHAAGDAMLSAVGQALKEEGADAYHASGDEFFVQHDDPAEIDKIMGRVEDRLAGATLEFEDPSTGKVVTLNGLGLSYGKGADLHEADNQLRERKTQREAEGKRSGRGEAPPGADVRSAEAGVQVQGSEAPAEESPELAGLRAVEAGTATPEQIHQLETSKLIVRNETGVPRLLPAGRRALAAVPRETPTEATEKPVQRTAGEPTNPSGQMELVGPEVPPGAPEPPADAPDRVSLTLHTVAGQQVWVNTKPTPKQKASGKYTKGVATFEGVPVAIENPKGTTRAYTDPDGKPGTRKMVHDYGEIPGTKGADGQPIDAFIVSNEETGKAFVINQINPKTGEFDEHKIILGAKSAGQAEAAYKANYQRGWKGVGSIVESTPHEVMQWATGPKATEEFPSQMALLSRNEGEGSKVQLASQRTDSESQLGFIRDYKAATHPNPFTHRSRVTNESWIEAEPWNGGILLNFINTLPSDEGTPNAGKRTGAGSRALRMLTDIADKNGVTMYLHAKKVGPNGLSTAQLKKWYQRNGFKALRGSDQLVREPQLVPAENVMLMRDLDPKNIADSIADKKHDGIDMGMTPGSLTKIGLPELRMLLPSGVATKVFYDHGLTHQQILNIPKLLERPIMVFKHPTEGPGNYIVYVHDQTADGPMMIALRANGTEGTEKYNVVVSAFGRKVPAAAKTWLKSGLLVAADRKAAGQWLKNNGISDADSLRIAGSAKQIQGPPSLPAVRAQAAKIRKAAADKAAAPAKHAQKIHAAIQKVVDHYSATNVNVVPTKEHLPESVKTGLKKMGAWDDSTPGIYWPPTGRVYLIGDAIRDEAHAFETTHHELVGHFGLRSMLTNSDYNEITDGIWRDMPDLARKYATRNGLDISIPEQKRAAAEEVIAYAAGSILSGKKPDARVMPWYSRLLDTIKGWLKAVRGEKYYNEAAIARIVQHASNHLKRENTAPNRDMLGRPVFQRAPKLYYSKVWEAINSNKVPAKAPFEEYVKILKSKTSYKTTENGPVWDGKDFSEEEWKWSGLLDFADLTNWHAMILSQADSSRSTNNAEIGLRYGAPKEAIDLLTDLDHINSYLSGDYDLSEKKPSLWKDVEDITAQAKTGNSTAHWNEIDSATKISREIENDLKRLPVGKINKEFLLDRIQAQQVQVSVAPYNQVVVNRKEINQWMEKYDPETVAQIQRNKVRTTTEEKPYEREPTEDERDERQREFDENIDDELNALERKLRTTDNYVDQSDYISESAAENVSNKDDSDWDSAIEEKLDEMDDEDFDTLMVELRDELDDEAYEEGGDHTFDEGDFVTPDDLADDAPSELYERWKTGNWHRSEGAEPFDEPFTLSDLTSDGKNKLVELIRERGEGRDATPESKSLWRAVEKDFLESEEAWLTEYYHGGEGSIFEYSASFDPGPNAADINVEITGSDDSGFTVRVDGSQVGAEYYGRNGHDEAIAAALEKVRELAWENSGPDLDAMVPITEEEAIELGIIDPPDQIALPGIEAPKQLEHLDENGNKIPPKPEPKYDEETKWATYQIDPQDETYGERLFTWTNPKEGYDFRADSHWGTKRNVLGHLRFTQKATPDGKKILYVEEAQSDWHQETRDTHKQWRDKQKQTADTRKKLEEQYSDYKTHRDDMFKTLMPRLFDGVNPALVEAMVHEWQRAVPGSNRRNSPNIDTGLSAYTTEGLINWFENQDQQWYESVINGSTGVSSTPPSAAYLERIADAESGLPRHAEPGWGTKDMPNREKVIGEWADTYSRARDTRAITPWLDLTYDMNRDTKLQQDAIRDLEDAFYPAKRYFEIGTHYSKPLTPEVEAEYNKIAAEMITPEAQAKRKRALVKFAYSGAMKQSISSVFAKDIDLTGEYRVEFHTLTKKLTSVGPEPQLPPVRNWSSMMMKWAIAEAHKRGLDGVGLAPGQVHGTRWHGTQSWGAVRIRRPSERSLFADGNMSWEKLAEANAIDSNHLALISFYTEPVPTSTVTGITGTAIAPMAASPKFQVAININQLSSWIGRDAATQFEKDRSDQTINSSVDKPVFGPKSSDSGIMERHFGQMDVYNNIQRNEINGFLKKYGAKLEDGEINWNGGNPLSVGLTPATRAGQNRVSLYDQTKTALMKYVGTISSTQLKENSAAAAQLANWNEPLLQNAINTGQEKFFVYDMLPRDGHPGSIHPLAFESESEAQSYARREFLINMADQDNVQRALMDKGETGIEEGGVASSVKSPVVWLNDKLKKAATDDGFPLFSRNQSNAIVAQSAAMKTSNFDLNDESPLSAAWAWLRFKVQDKFIDLLKTQRQLAAYRGAMGLPEQQDAYLKQELYSGKAEQDIEEHTKKFVDPLIAAIKDSGYTWEQVEDYLYARHAPERNARMASINPKDPTFGSGMTNAQAATKLLDLRQAGRLQQARRDRLHDRLDEPVDSRHDGHGWAGEAGDDRRLGADLQALRPAQGLGERGRRHHDRAHAEEGQGLRHGWQAHEGGHRSQDPGRHDHRERGGAGPGHHHPRAEGEGRPRPVRHGILHAIGSVGGG